MKYLKRTMAAVLFFAGLALLLSLVSAVVIPKDNSEAAGMEETKANGILGEPENTIDVLVLGDSEAYSAIVPMELWKRSGITSYVCGTANQKLPYSYTLLKRALRTQKPKVVILETLAIYRKITAEDMMTEALAAGFPVFQYHNRWKSLKSTDFSGKPTATYQHADKGHWTSTEVKPATSDSYMNPDVPMEQIKLANRKYVALIKNLCERNGAKLMLLSTPSPVNWDYGRHKGIQKLAQEIHCEYLDLNLMNDQIKINWKNDTRDQGDHLNHFGAVKVSAFLSEYLIKAASLNDHRTDNAYSRWNEELKQYEAQYA